MIESHLAMNGNKGIWAWPKLRPRRSDVAGLVNEGYGLLAILVDLIIKNKRENFKNTPFESICWSKAGQFDVKFGM